MVQANQLGNRGGLADAENRAAAAEAQGAGGGDRPGVPQMQMRNGDPAAQSPEISHTGNTHEKECIYVGT